MQMVSGLIFQRFLSTFLHGGLNFDLVIEHKLKMGGGPYSPLNFFRKHFFKKFVLGP